MISLFETLALDLNHRAINRLYSYRKKKVVQNTVSYQTQEIITWISMLQVTGRGYWFSFSRNGLRLNRTYTLWQYFHRFPRDTQKNFYQKSCSKI